MSILEMTSNAVSEYRIEEAKRYALLTDYADEINASIDSNRFVFPRGIMAFIKRVPGQIIVDEIGINKQVKQVVDDMVDDIDNGLVGF
jgi:hypothetical protein